jgi:PAS domain S-box-containing protein
MQSGGPHAVGAAEVTDELLHLAIRVGNIGIFDSDLERKRTRFSRELCAILGLPVGTVVSHEEAWLLVDERDRAWLRASINGAAASGDKGRYNAVHRVVRTDGSVRWLSVHGCRIYRQTPNGPQAVRSIATVIDITDVKETEDALRESELRLRFALEAAQMGTFEADIAGTEAIIDAQEARLLGLPEGTRVVSAEKLRTCVPLDDLNASDAKKVRLTEYGEAYYHEFRFRLPNGSERWLSAHADVRGNRIFGINFDITERKLAEVQLRESEARLRVATSAASLGVFERDLKADRTVWLNDRMYEIFGRSRADGSLRRETFIEEYLHPDDADAFEQARNDAIRSGHLHAICRIRLRGGRQRWLQIDGTYQLTEQGEPSRLVGVVADITERKNLEQEAKELSGHLISLQEEERQRIAQELHDTTAQHLVAVNLNLMRLRPQGGLTSDGVSLWDETEACLQEAMKEIRTFSNLMHPPALQAGGLTSTIQEYVGSFRNRSKLDVRIRLNPKLDRLGFDKQRTLLRIVQEALSNVHRHASASHVTLDFRCLADRVHLIVRDDGHGGESSNGRATFGSGRGVRGMAARAHQYGGELRIRMGSQGTIVHVVMPALFATARKPAGIRALRTNS